MCRPVGGFWAGACPGGHIGPPLHDMGWCSGTTGNWRRTEAFPTGAGRSPPPTGGGAGLWRRGAPGVWSPRPTGASQVVHSSGPMYLRHGFRRPNFVPKFGASVRSAAPTESPISHPSQPARSEASAPAAARDGRESTQEPSPKGTAPATTPAALSEAESAEREAGQVRFCSPDECHATKCGDAVLRGVPIGAAGRRLLDLVGSL